ncbi:MAG TPA: xanthine dehydrogenase family protein subunit M [Bryobacteraceae bacterium]
MNTFNYNQALTVDDALASVYAHPDAKYLGGGTNLIDLMKMGVEHPTALVDVTRLPLTRIEEYWGGLRLGAMARNSAVAIHALVRRRYPVLAQALLAGASPQIRNMATVAGNLLQRTRCYYFYDPSYRECNKRNPGSGCAALTGNNRIHSVLGGSDHCIATHPSDMAVALTALGATVQVKDANEERSIPIADFYRMPGNTPHIETSLKAEELITSVDLPAPPGGTAHYLKVRDRNSFAFALVSVAAIVELDDRKRIRSARVALGGVAPMPWRSLEAEQVLTGGEPTEATYRKAADILMQDAKPLRFNGFKVELARRGIVRALTTAAELN